MANSHTGKPSAERVPRKQSLSGSTVYAYDSQCRRIIKKHHNEMKHYPEHLTTDFMIKITKCNCKLKQGESDD
jgi:hypothetical protein